MCKSLPCCHLLYRSTFILISKMHAGSLCVFLIHQNTDMDYGGWAHQQRVSTTFFTRKNSQILYCAPDRIRPFILWILSPTLYQLSHPVTPYTCTRDPVPNLPRLHTRSSLFSINVPVPTRFLVHAGFISGVTKSCYLLICFSALHDCSIPALQSFAQIWVHGCKATT